jgi:hypothetical protein
MSEIIFIYEFENYSFFLFLACEGGYWSYDEIILIRGFVERSLLVLFIEA